MHVAVCDDNVADRKHIERLLSRESDKRSGTTNILYIESYGNKEHFLSGNPFKYNIIFMDMCSEPGIVEEILSTLDASGYNAPVILYSSKIDYTAIPNLPDFVIHEKKPYISDPLPEYLKLGDAHVSKIIATVSVHSNSAACQIPKDSILYALESESGSTLCLSDKGPLKVDETIGELYQIFEPYEEFVLVNRKSIANFRFVSKLRRFNLVMKDKTKLFISPFRYKEHLWKLEDLKD